MRREFPARSVTAAVLVTLLAMSFTWDRASHLDAKEKTQAVGPEDATYRLFQVLDTSRAGKLSDFYVIADIYKDSKNNDEEFQHVLRAEYDKNRGFGKFNLYVRSVGKIAPEQLQTYSPKQIYEFGAADAEKFVKTGPGPFGRQGDIYLRAVEDRPLASSPITEQVRKTYEFFLTQYLLPAVQKKSN